MHYLAMRGKDPYVGLSPLVFAWPTATITSYAHAALRLPGVQFESNDAQVSFWRQVETISPHQLLEAYEPSLANCNVSFVNLVNADGEVRYRRVIMERCGARH